MTIVLWLQQGTGCRHLLCRCLESWELNPALRSPHTPLLVGVTTPVLFEALNPPSPGWDQQIVAMGIMPIKMTWGLGMS